VVPSLFEIVLLLSVRQWIE